MNKYFLSHARVGIYLAILNEKISPDDKILLPDFICESVPNFLISKGLKIEFYKIDLNLKVKWKDLKQNIDEKCKIIVAVNYFGFPLEIEKFLTFSKKNNLILIEDSTHGHSGHYNNKLLGTFGKYGVTSPRKHLPLPYGSILYSKSRIDIVDKINVFYKTSKIRKLNFYFTKNFINFKLFLKKYISRNFKDLESNYEPIVHISGLDNFTKRIISNYDWEILKKTKRNNYNKWISFLEKKKIQPLILEKALDLNPWACPVKFSSKKEVIKWLNWGKNNRVIVYNWPNLHKSIKKSSDAYHLSRNLVCFSTYHYHDF